MHNKRGLSEVIVTVLIILISIAAIFLVWQFLKPTLKEEAGSINLDKVKVDLEINRNSLVKSSVNDSFKINVIRNAGEGDLVKIKVRVENETDAAIYEFEGIPELGERQLSVPNTIANYAKIRIIPIVRVGNNEGEAGIADTLVVRDVETQEEAPACSLPSNLQCTLGTKQCKAGTNVTQTCYHNSTNLCDHWIDSVTCTAPQFCSNGNCVNVVCSSNANCGSNVYSANFCSGGNVYRNYTAFTCNNPGTVSSSCSNTITPVLNQTCTNGCSNGACISASIPLSGCAILDQANKVYVLNKSIVNNTVVGSCMNIIANNITFDCKGYSITGEDYFYLIHTTANNTLITNCNLTGYNDILFNKSISGKVFNNNITARHISGVHLWYSRGINISKNNFTSGDRHVLLSYSNDNTITDNVGKWAGNYALYFLTSNNNIVRNFFIERTNYGLNLEQSSKNNSFYNLFINNSGRGVWIWEGSNNNYFFNMSILNSNVAADSNAEVAISESNNNQFINSTISVGTSYGYNYGFSLEYSNNNTFYGNLIEKMNSYGTGVYLVYSDNNTFRNNIIRNNTQYGLRFSSSKDNLFVNNYFHNVNNSVIYSSTNFWNTTLTSRTNIIGGSRIGGNYWAQTNGQGFSQTCTTSNGICTTSNTIASGNIDYYSLRN